MIKKNNNNINQNDQSHSESSVNWKLRKMISTIISKC